VKITVFEAGGVGSLLRRFSAFVVVFGCLLPALVEGPQYLVYSYG